MTVTTNANRWQWRTVKSIGCLPNTFGRKAQFLGCQKDGFGREHFTPVLVLQLRRISGNSVQLRHQHQALQPAVF